jgi:glycosyltransferase involved in cell wall biosynthesis
MKHFVFATYELQPVTPGGAGVLIAGAVRSLVRAGHHVTVLADLPVGEIDEARRHAALENVGHGRLEIASVDEQLERPRLQGSVFHRNSERFRLALDALNAATPIDVVEFPEYAGMGVASLRAHRVENWMSSTLFAVRVHGSLEFIDRAEGILPGQERLEMYAMERDGLRLADLILVPSESMGAHYVEDYGLAQHRVVLSPPPMEDLLSGLASRPRLPDPGHFLFFGKLQEVKGCVQLAEAAVAAISADPTKHWRFTFIGRDTHCSKHDQSTFRCVTDQIPESARPQFVFLPGIERVSLPKFCVRPAAAIFPSRFETFCLAAHEVRAMGVPLIVPAIPAFADSFNASTGCLTYDGTTAGLQRAIERVRSDVELRVRLELADRPTYPPFTAAYDRISSKGPRIARPSVAVLER